MNSGEIWSLSFSRHVIHASWRGNLLEIISLGILNLCFRIILIGAALPFLIVIL